MFVFIYFQNQEGLVLMVLLWVIKNFHFSFRFNFFNLIKLMDLIFFSLSPEVLINMLDYLNSLFNKFFLKLFDY